MEKEALVAHHFWNEPGGAELTMASAAQALYELGIRTSILSPNNVDKRKYKEFFGIDLSSIPVLGPKLELKGFALYSRLLLFPLLLMHEKGDEIVLTDSPFYKKNGSKIIEYIHFPLEIYFSNTQRASELQEEMDPYIGEKYSKSFYYLYWKLFTKISPIFARRNPFESASLVLVNSRWTGNIVREVYGEKPTVLNPPIPPSMEIVERPRDFEEREKSVVMIGRYSEEKRYHWVIEEVLPRLLREDPEIRLYIIGSSSTPHSRAYVSRLMKLAGSMGIKISEKEECSESICLLLNAPSELKLKIMDRSRVFMHATVNEHWGIAVAEAMARGIPAVIHRSGGAWSDLAEDGRNALGYVDGDEAADAVLRLMNNEGEWRRLSRASVERVKELNLKEYARKLGELLKKI
ncbi:MAG: glycosyltransferase [Fervidicoccaceae archaeon]